MRDLENLEFRIQKIEEEEKLRYKEQHKMIAARKASTDKKNMSALAQLKEMSSNRKTPDNTWGNNLLEFLLPKKLVMMLLGLIVFLVIVAIITKIL